MSDSRNVRAVVQRAFLALATAYVLALTTGSGAIAAEPAKQPSVKSKPMNMDEPMAGEMKRESMKKGDVKKAAEQWDRKMRKMMQAEQKSGTTAKK